MRDLKKAFQFSSVYQHMEPDEFLSLKLIEASIAGALVGLILGFSLGPVVGLASFLVVVAVYIPLAENETRGISSQTKNRFLLRLPNAVDLLSLMLEAGATFPDALDTVVNENKGHPLGDQFGQVAREMALGRPRSESLRALRERMDDIVVDELIMAINEGEELGTPLAKILSSQAERMRLKKSQWIEKAAAEAQVKMAFPSLLIMIACSLVVLGPFVLQAVFQFLGE
jgi:tight adherence protein C